MRMTPRGTVVAMVITMVTTAGIAQAQTPTYPEPAVAQTPAVQAPTVTVGGVVYTQYNYQLSGVDHLNAFEVTRTYINVNARFAGGVSARITPDIYRNAADGSATYRLKYGYVQYAPGATTWKFGMIQTPWVGREEDLWGYRMQGTIAVDRNKFLSSSDFGVSADTRLMDGALDLNVGIYNGETYSKPEGDQRKDLMVRASYRLAETDDNGALGGIRVSGYAGIGKPTGGGERNRFLGMLSYQSKALTLAAEYGMMTDSSTATPTAEVEASVVTAFAVVRVPESRLAVIGRVDIVDPNTDADDDKVTRTIAGVSYQVSPNLRALLDVDLLSYEGPVAVATYRARQQALFQLQLTF
jgi:hypothetical protein